MSTDIVKALRDEAVARRTPTGDFLPLSDKVTADLLESAANEIEDWRLQAQHSTDVAHAAAERIKELETPAGPEVFSYDPTPARCTVTLRWPDGRCLAYRLDPERYTGEREQVSATTSALIELLIQRDQAGRAKYGTTLDRTDLTREEWLQHLIEELLDGAGYALRAKQVAP